MVKYVVHVMFLEMGCESWTQVCRLTQQVIYLLNDLTDLNHFSERPTYVILSCQSMSVSLCLGQTDPDKGLSSQFPMTVPWFSLRGFDDGGCVIPDLVFQTKCEEYWPSKQAQEYGDITVAMTLEVVLPEWTIRDFVVKNVSQD